VLIVGRSKIPKTLSYACTFLGFEMSLFTKTTNVHNKKCKARGPGPSHRNSILK